MKDGKFVTADDDNWKTIGQGFQNPNQRKLLDIPTTTADVASSDSDSESEEKEKKKKGQAPNSNTKHREADEPKKSASSKSMVEKKKSPTTKNDKRALVSSSSSSSSSSKKSSNSDEPSISLCPWWCWLILLVLVAAAAGGVVYMDKIKEMFVGKSVPKPKCKVSPTLKEQLTASGLDFEKLKDACDGNDKDQCDCEQHKYCKPSNWYNRGTECSCSEDGAEWKIEGSCTEPGKGGIVVWCPCSQGSDGCKKRDGVWVKPCK